LPKGSDIGRLDFYCDDFWRQLDVYDKPQDKKSSEKCLVKEVDPKHCIGKLIGQIKAKDTTAEDSK